jgi:chromosomal replication initiator protein
LFTEKQTVEISIELVKEKVCSHFRLSIDDIIGKKRPANIAFPRQIAMYLCRLMTSKSLADIGEAFGGRDHGTVSHACKTVENTAEHDIATKRILEILQKMIAHSS